MDIRNSFSSAPGAAPPLVRVGQGDYVQDYSPLAKLPEITHLLMHEPADAYHAARKDYLTSHRLADFRRCPQLYLRKQSGQIQDEDCPAYQIGRAAHTLILEGRDKLLSGYAVGGPVNPKTGEPYGATTKAFAEWAAAQGKPVITLEQARLIDQMAEGVMSHGIARHLLSKGIAEAVTRCQWHGMACQIRLDWFSLVANAAIVDLKTCDDLTWFEADARRYGYAHQLAFYRSVLAVAVRMDPREIPVHLIAVEKRDPFRCGVWKMGEDVLAIAQRENEESVNLLRQCRATGYWPTGYETIRTFDFV